MSNLENIAISEDKLKQLREPFTEDEIEWRVQSSGDGENGKIWVRVLCYVSARAIQNRLDEVFGYDGWRVEYRPAGENMICRISVWSDRLNQWIYKEDGSSPSNTDAFKGAISGAMKRCASAGFGIGRYLYELDAVYAKEVVKERPRSTKGWFSGRTKQNISFWWKAPELPATALPNKAKSLNNKKNTSNPVLSSDKNITKEQVSVINKIAKEKGLKKADYNEVLKSLSINIKPVSDLSMIEAEKVTNALKELINDEKDEAI